MPAFPFRLDNESARAYAAFTAYCAMGPGRSLDKVGQQLGYKSATAPGHVTRWSTDYQWQTRVRAYDDDAAVEYAASIDATRRAEIEAYRTQVLADADRMRTLWEVTTTRLMERIEALSPDEIAPNQIAPLLRALSALLDTTTNQRATVLGVADVLRYLEGQQQRETQ